MAKKQSAKAQGKGRTRKGAKTRAKAGLTAKQEAFCHEYVRNGRVGAQAYRKCYEPGPQATNQSIAEQAHKLLGHSGVAARIEELSTALRAKMEVTTERVLRETARVAFLDPAELWETKEDGTQVLRPVTEMSEDARRAIAGLEVVQIEEDGKVVGYTAKLKLASKVPALDLLAACLGLKVTKVEDKGKGGTLIMNIHTT